MITQNQDSYLYECHCPTGSCCNLECYCPCIYYIHQNPDMNHDFNPNISQPILISKNEKAIFGKFKKNTKKHHKSSKKDIKISNSRYKDNNIIDDYFSKTSIEMNQNRNIDMNPGMKTNIKSNNNKYMNKTFTDNIVDDIGDYIVFKKLKIYDHKKERSMRQFSGTNNPKKKQKQKKKIRKIDMNNCAPIIPNKKIRPKYFNKFELNKNNSEKMNKISINQKSVDDIKKYNSIKLNFTENLDEQFNLNSNFLMGNKFRMSDLNDDIIENQQNYSKEENSENKITLEKMKKEIDNANSLIDNLKIENNNLKVLKKESEQIKILKKENEQLNLLRKENEKLKKFIYGKDQNLEIKINKSTNTPIYNEKENEKYQKAKFENEVKNLKNEISEIKNKLNEYEKFISLLKKRNKELETIIKNKDKEIKELNDKIGILEKENKNMLNELNIKSNEVLKERNDISSDLKLSNDSLKLEIEKLKEIVVNKNMQIKELEIKLKYGQKFDSKMQNLLDMLFNFYLNIKKVINFDKIKESLKNVVEKVALDEFKIKLDKVEKKFVQIIDDIQIRYGHCLACDIACCTSNVDKLKTFRKVNPKKK